MNSSRILILFKKEFKHLVRNRRVLAIVLLVPILMMTLIGYAFSGDVKQVPTLVVDQSGSDLSRRLVEALNRTEVSKIELNDDWSSARVAIDEDRVKAAILIPSSFALDVARRNATVHLLLDGSDPVSSSAVAGVLQRISLAFTPTLTVQVNQTVLFNPELRYIEFIAPGAVSLILQMLPVILVALSVAGEKERGTIEQLIATPVSKMDILLSKMLVYIVIGLTEATLMLTVAHLLFGLTIRGSLILLAAIFLLFLAASLGLGILSSSFAKNQVQAVQQVQPVLLLSVFLSGIFYPIESMPEFIRPFSYLIPLTYVNHATRAIIVKGAGLTAVANDLIFLTAYTVIVMALALRSFRKRVE